MKYHGNNLKHLLKGRKTKNLSEIGDLRNLSRCEWSCFEDISTKDDLLNHLINELDGVGPVDNKPSTN